MHRSNSIRGDYSGSLRLHRTRTTENNQVIPATRLAMLHIDRIKGFLRRTGYQDSTTHTEVAAMGRSDEN